MKIECNEAMATTAFSSNWNALVDRNRTPNVKPALAPSEWERLQNG